MKPRVKRTIKLEANLIISNTDNGWLLEYNNPNDEGKLTEVIEGSPYGMGDVTFDDAKAIRTLLWSVRNALGLSYSKHNTCNVDIIIRDHEGYEIDDRTGKRVELDTDD